MVNNESGYKNNNFNIKIIFYFILIFTEILLINNRYNKYIELKSEKLELIKNNVEINNKISQILESNLKIEKEVIEKNKQIDVLLRKIELLSIRSESDFKRMIYILARESGLEVKEMSKGEKVWDKNGMSLKYIFFNLYGSLNDFGEFMYYVNKSKKYIDTSKMYIELSGDIFKISLGYIEKNKIEIK